MFSFLLATGNANLFKFVNTSFKKQKGGTAKERDKNITKLHIAAQLCHSILRLFKKSADQVNSENINLKQVSDMWFYYINNNFFIY